MSDTRVIEVKSCRACYDIKGHVGGECPMRWSEDDDSDWQEYFEKEKIHPNCPLPKKGES